MTTLTINKKCGRCTRMDQQEITTEEVVRRAQAGQALEDSTPALELLIRGRPLVSFAHLCPPCVSIVGSHIEHIGAVLEKVSATRKPRKAKDPQAAPEPTPARAPGTSSSASKGPKT